MNAAPFTQSLPASPQLIPRLLALEASGDFFSVALQTPLGQWEQTLPAGPKASAGAIAAIEALLEQTGTTLSQLDALAFGQGPGAFTGLRTACALAQGLALGCDVPVLPVDTLHAVLLHAVALAPPPWPQGVCWVVMDARMGEVYAASFRQQAGEWVLDAPAQLWKPAALNLHWQEAPPTAVAGTACQVHEASLNLPEWQAQGVALWPEARPWARFLLPLACKLWQARAGVDAAGASPLYVRNQVAQTLVQRQQAKAGAGLA
jgi:tRNA threonylcarbamoyladenosine biosynthesis protein TsaB